MNFKLLLASFLMLFSTSCASLSGQDNGTGIGVTTYFSLRDAEGSVVADGRTNGTTTMLFAYAEVHAGIRFSQTGIHIRGPHLIDAGKIWIANKDLDFDKTFEQGEALPWWLPDTMLFYQDELDALGVTIEPRPAAPTVAPESTVEG
jgi:hypothetical protein